MAALLAAGSYPRWRAVQRAMRAERPLPSSRVVTVLAVRVLVVTMTAGILVVVG
ncbi:hypothetical protein LZG04_11630 [Saccharothrix sp. S26]|uniref:hypothetical protein n=1 Tax=Saccharothrix sp. S26 TaxID=2907215 RepID=UPI001F32E4D7|nr:hypothetical protein [Saccharothrix sp. S26]MCE6995450.1 hypothetical protein [Saccharothrix sp. S26]